MTQPLIPVARPWMDDREADAARRAIRSGWTTQGPEVEAFLTSLAVQGRVSASTQNQALAAVLFLYRDDRDRHP